MELSGANFNRPPRRGVGTGQKNASNLVPASGLFVSGCFVFLLQWQLVNLEIKTSAGIAAGKSDGLQPNKHRTVPAAVGSLACVNYTISSLSLFINCVYMYFFKSSVANSIVLLFISRFRNLIFAQKAVGNPG